MQKHRKHFKETNPVILETVIHKSLIAMRLQLFSVLGTLFKDTEKLIETKYSILF